MRVRSQVAIPCVLLMLVCLATLPALGQGQKTFPTPEQAVQALEQAAKAGDTEALMAIFGPEGKEILSSGDPVADQHNREVFVAALAEGWRLMPRGARKELVIGAEDFPFAIPLARTKAGWRFDTAAGKEEVLARRVGRNELSVIRACSAYVAAQRDYARRGHDGKPEGLYARRIVSDPGLHNGLYWPARGEERLSPLGELAAEAAEEGYTRAEKPRPFHGYHFRILTGQGKAAPGGAKSYLANGEMTGGFALIAHPAEYGNSGVMTFIVSQDGVIYEKDLGPDTAKAAAVIQEYNPDRTWRPVQ